MQSALVSSPVLGRPTFSVAQLPRAGRASRTPVVTRAAAIAAEDVPDMGKRVRISPSSSSSPAANVADSKIATPSSVIGRFHASGEDGCWQMCAEGGVSVAVAVLACIPSCLGHRP